MRDLLPVNGKQMDRRDAALIATVNRTTETFKVETVERLEAMRSEIDEMRRLVMQAMGVIKVTNTLQPEAEAVEVRYYVERQGMKFETTQQIANEATARGQVSWRETTMVERYEVDPAKLAETEQVVAQLRKMVG